MSSLKQMLTFFEERPMSLAEMARELGISEAVAEDMLQFWVRKGKLRLVVDLCGTCGGTCPMVSHAPRRYELAKEGTSTPPTPHEGACCSRYS